MSIDQRLLDLLTALPVPNSCIAIQDQERLNITDDQQQQQKMDSCQRQQSSASNSRNAFGIQSGSLASSLEIKHLTTMTATLDTGACKDANLMTEQKQLCTRELVDDIPKLLYQGDPTIVAAAAAAAAVKFRSNYLPPIGVFWDIENCQVPKGRSAMAVTQVIRETFFKGYKEAEFVVVCDVQKENKQIVQELNDAQVDLIHVSATCKNAADDKLRQSIRRFADTHGSPSAIILISGDINFASDLTDLRHRKKIYIILLHKINTSEALIMCANEHYDFMELLQSLPSRSPVKQMSEPADLLVCNLPDDRDVVGIKRRLKQLSNNCGGRVVQIRSNSAVVRFNSKESANRAQKRMHGEFVFNSRIKVKFLKDQDTSCDCDKSRETSAILTSEAEAINGSETVSDQEATNGSEAAAKSAVVNSSEADNSSETDNESPNEMYGVVNSMAGVRSLPGTPHYMNGSPVMSNYPAWSGMHCGPQGAFPPHPHGFGRPYGMNDSCRSYMEHAARSQSPQLWPPMNSQQMANRHWDDRCKSRDNFTPEGPSFRQSKTGHMRGVPFPQIPEWSTPRGPWSVGSSHNNSMYTPARKRRSPSPLYGSQNQDTGHWNNQAHNISRRSDRTPSPYEMSSLSASMQRNVSPYRQSDTENEEVENFFSPINSRNNGLPPGVCQPIELQVTNLDQNIDPKDMKRILSTVFMEHVMVLQVVIFTQSDGNYAATIKVPSISEAQYAISQLHRRKVGYKRILISYVHTGGPNPQIVRAQIVMLLQEVPGHKLPLFKFREMYENRFMIAISISDLYKMKDVCVITDDPSGRLVSLSPDHRNTPSPCLNNTLDPQNLELPYCTIHPQKPVTDKGWAEQEMASLPDIKISLKVLADRVHKLLISHSGSLPLPSFPNCYEAEFNEPLNVDENGVPLEHLMSCIPSIELRQGLGSVKHIVRSGNRNHDESHDESKCISPPLANQLSLFSRELVDLLKTAPHCQLSFNKFIPSYHHHFGRQCRVADYGFTKLIELLEALSHTVQVMGEGNKRVVTLSHRAQVRRFTSDLLRVLKAQASKQVALSEFPMVYSRVIGKPWDIADYGVCELDDILREVSENTVVVTNTNDGEDRLIAIPKREQTADEIERTRKFATEVIELLKHAPQQRMLFNKFVPSYHHHFGHQCRVSDYGFTKLIELFEAIPDIVKIEEVNGGERRISLTEQESLRVLGEQITKLIARFGNSTNGQLMVSNVAQTFLQEFGYALRPELFNCGSTLQLMEKLEGTVKIVNTRNGVAMVSIDKSHIQLLGLQCRRILFDMPNNSMPLNKFEHCYEQYFHKKCLIEKYAHTLDLFIIIDSSKNEKMIELTPLQRFACMVQKVLTYYNGRINAAHFENAYLKVIGSACRPAQLGYQSVQALLKAIPCTVVIKDVRHRKKVLQLNKKLASVGLLSQSYLSSPSPHRDTDSSNDSIENDYLLASRSSTNLQTDDRSKWDNNLQQSQQFAWNNSPNKWDKSADHWALSGNDSSQKWSSFPPPPPKPDTPELNGPRTKDNRWQSSIWATPPKFNFSQDLNLTNVEVPPFTLSPLKQTADSSNLMSPTKNLLPAAANPLNPRVSPYFANKRNLVVAPHPSELPLPTLSFTPPRETMSRNYGAMKNDELATSPVSSQKNTSNRDNEKDNIDRINETPSKRTFFGKCRLAAQFNQPPVDQ